MNTRSHELKLSVTARQVEDVTKAIFHSILFHRSTGKYSYSNPGSGTFSVGTLGMEDMDCSTVNFTYVRCSSADLEQWLTQQLEGFTAPLSQQNPTGSGKVTLEFYERKKGRWLGLGPAETINWEVWRLQLVLVSPGSDQEWQDHQQKLVDALAEVVLYISDVVNRPEYIPRNPTFENLPNVFDVRFSQVQPYLHRVTFELAGESVAGAMRKLLHTFAY